MDRIPTNNCGTSSSHSLRRPTDKIGQRRQQINNSATAKPCSACKHGLTTSCQLLFKIKTRTKRRRCLQVDTGSSPSSPVNVRKNRLSIVRLFLTSSSFVISFTILLQIYLTVHMQIVLCSHQAEPTINDEEINVRVDQQQAQPVALAKTAPTPTASGQQQNRDTKLLHNQSQQQLQQQSSSSSGSNGQLSLIDHWKGCQLLGFPNATLNKCGYCVGPGTNLPLDYGQDCLGVCDGGARLDCRGQCNGEHFLDECSLECIDDHDFYQGYSRNRDCRGLCLPQLPPGDAQRASATANSNNNNNNNNNETTQQQATKSAYILDDCRSCRLQNGHTQSPYVDCAGQCWSSYLSSSLASPTKHTLPFGSAGPSTPNTSHRSIFESASRARFDQVPADNAGEFSLPKVRPYATTMCDQCILFGSGDEAATQSQINRLLMEAKLKQTVSNAPPDSAATNATNVTAPTTTTTTIKTPSQVLNSCNKCKSDPTELCNCHLSPKSCGCGSLKQLQENGCYRVTTLQPTLLPAAQAVQLRLNGYFSRARDDIMCLFQHETGQQYSFKLEIALLQQAVADESIGSYNAHCHIDLPLAGNYLFGLGSTQDAQVNLNVDNELIVYAYDQARVQLLSMTPARMLTFGEPDDVTLTFETATQPLTQFPLKCALLFDDNKYIIIQNEDAKNPYSCVIKMASLDQQQQLAAAALLLQQQQQQQQRSTTTASLPLFSHHQSSAAVNEALANASPGANHKQSLSQQQQQQIESQQDMQQLLQRSRIVRVFPTLDGINPIVDEPFELVIVAPPPIPLPLASFVTNDGLTISVTFDRPVNLTASIEAVQRRRSSHLKRTSQSQVHRYRRQILGEGAPADQWTDDMWPEPSLLEPRVSVLHSSDISSGANTGNAGMAGNASNISGQYSTLAERKADKPSNGGPTATGQQSRFVSSSQQVKRVQGVHLCAQLLTKKTLKLLRKYQLRNCVWPSRAQFIVELGKPIGQNQSSIRLTFNTGVISEHDQHFALVNERELSIDVKKIPLETLGLPSAPALALTGPNQVPQCGQFTLATHLWSPYGTGAGLKFRWSVDRLASIPLPAVPSSPAAGSGSMRPATSSSSSNRSAADQSTQQQPSSQQSNSNVNNNGNVTTTTTLHNDNSAITDHQLLQLRAYVHSVRSANLIVDAQLLRKSTLYKFQVEVTFADTTTANNNNNNKQTVLTASHDITKLDFDAPVATLFSSQQLPAMPLTTQHPVVLLAEINVPPCATKAKQVGLYWQVSDARVRFDFDQTFSPIYTIKPNSLPDNVPVAFRMNLFYGIRVKKFSIAGTVLRAAKAPPEADISEGVWTVTIGQQSNHYIELAGPATNSNRYNYQWSCHDGRTAQPCYRALSQLITAAADTRLGKPEYPDDPDQDQNVAAILTRQHKSGQKQPTSGVLLVDRQQQRQSLLRIPAAQLESNGQLWFGLQLFDKLNPTGQQSNTEYTLVTVKPGTGPMVAVGPVFVGRGRSQSLLRHPLTGSVILPAHTQAIIRGKVGAAGSDEIKSIGWHSANIVQPLEWTIKKNSTANNSEGTNEIVTELHLNADYQIPYASFQFQLTACNSRDACSTAAISVNVVPSVSQCRVDVGQHLLSQTFVISVEYCNIPLGLSPISYQIYLIDLSPVVAGQDGAGAPGLTGSGEPGQEHAASNIFINDDDMNEADEAYLESRAQPLTIPQYTPLFQLDGFNVPAIVALLSRANNQDKKSSRGTISQMRIKFAAKVCDRFQYCRMFYSPTTSLESQRELLQTTTPTTDSPLHNSNNNNNNNGRKQQQSEQHSSLSEQVNKVSGSLQTMMDQARRYNLAGNSLAALSVLNNLINVAERVLTSLPGSQQQQLPIATAVGGNNQQQTTTTARERLISATTTTTTAGNATAIVDFGNGDISNGNGNDNSRQETEEDRNRLKIKSLLNQSLVDVLTYGRRVLQRPFHLTDSGQSNLVSHLLNRIIRLSGNDLSQRQNATTLLTQITRKAIETSSSEQAFFVSVPDFKSIQGTYESIFEQATSAGLSPNKQRDGKFKFKLFASNTNSNNNNNNLAYSKSIRSAYKSLLSAAALQLPLGDTQQFRYVGPALTSANIGTKGAVRSIVSTTLSHVVRLEDIRVSVPNFGSITIRFDDRLKQRLNNGLGTCRSPTSQATESAMGNSDSGDKSEQGKFRRAATTKRCESFVLSTTTFVARSPHQSLDSGTDHWLRVPIVDIDILSPMDGSSVKETYHPNYKILIGFDVDNDKQGAQEINTIITTNTNNQNIQNNAPLDTSATTTTNKSSGLAEQSAASSAAGTRQVTTTTSNNENGPSSVDLPLGQLVGRSYKCYAYDESEDNGLGQWTRKSVSEAVSYDSHRSCWTNHLGTFALFKSPLPDKDAQLSIMLLLIVAVILVSITIIVFLLSYQLGSGKNKRRQSEGSQSQ